MAPLSIIRESGQFVPIFACGWNVIPFSLFQRRLLMTIYEHAFLSLTDFQTSPAEVLFFPKTKFDGITKRVAEVWHRADYELLEKNALDEAVEIFLLARDTALRHLRERASEWTPSKNDDDDPPPGRGSAQPSLF